MAAEVIDLSEQRRLRDNAKAERYRRRKGVKPRVYAGPTKSCSRCKEEKDRKTDFYQTTRNGNLIAVGWCKQCQATEQRTRDWAKRLVQQTKARHKKRWPEIEFDLTPEHLHGMFGQQSGKCLWFGVPLRTDLVGLPYHHPNQVSLDRADPTKGYTRDNVLLVCTAANLARCDAPLEEFEIFVESLRRT